MCGVVLGLCDELGLCIELGAACDLWLLLEGLGCVAAVLCLPTVIPSSVAPGKPKSGLICRSVRPLDLTMLGGGGGTCKEICLCIV